jgi:hypothetical protein
MSAPVQPSLSDRSENEFLFALFEDLSEEIRKRRDPEYIFAAAAVGSFGAVSWGVASLSTSSSRYASFNWRSPAVVAAFSVGVLAVAVIFKIFKDHSVYVELRKEQIRIAAILATHLAAGSDMLPDRYRRCGSSRGFLWSIFIVISAALGAIAFCLSFILAPL